MNLKRITETIAIRKLNRCTDSKHINVWVSLWLSRRASVSGMCREKRHCFKPRLLIYFLSVPLLFCLFSHPYRPLAYENGQNNDKMARHLKQYTILTCVMVLRDFGCGVTTFNNGFITKHYHSKIQLLLRKNTLQFNINYKVRF